MKNIEKDKNVKALEEPLPKRQTVVTKGITRTIQTANYFSLTIHHTAQDTIEWSDLEERDKKISNLNKLVIKDFVKNHDTVLDQLKLGQQHAFTTDHVAKKRSMTTANSLDLEEMDEVE